MSGRTVKSKLRDWAGRLRGEALALYLAVRDPRTPWYAKAVAALVVAYAFSPIDLIPDFIPVLGYLDDLLIIPVGIALAIRLVPESVLADCRADAVAKLANRRPGSRIGAILVVLLWLATAAIVLALLL